MARKRRKLDKGMEQTISSAQKQVELISAKINDIDEEDIQIEYRQAFEKVVVEVTSLAEYYKTSGFTQESEAMVTNYHSFLDVFLSEYEL